MSLQLFKKSVAIRHSPPLHLLTTLECDAVVRTASTHKSLVSLLQPHLPSPYTFISKPPITPVWIDATRRLQEAALNPKNVTALVDAYQQCMEDVSAVSPHQTFADPVLTVRAAWVGEGDLIKNLDSLSTDDENAFVLMVMRRTGQDENALQRALEAVKRVYGENRVLLVRISDEEEEHHSPEKVAVQLAQLANTALANSISNLQKHTEKQRRATRSTFRSWFAPTNRPPEPSSERRLSLSGRPPPPLPPDSLEYSTRLLADRYVVAQNYAAAAETYRLLAYDLRNVVGPRKIHLAAAMEMLALTTALLDGSKQAVGSGMERSIVAYYNAGRTDLAVRATLRAAQFCNQAGFPDSATGVIIRAMQVIVRDGSLIHSSGDSFVDCAIAVISAACSVAYAQLGRLRRESYYAFIAASHFSDLRLFSPAACVAAQVHPAAMFTPSVADHIDWILGEAAVEEDLHSRAITHFSSILMRAAHSSDAEMQSLAICSFLIAAESALKRMKRAWDSGVQFPIVNTSQVTLITYDSTDDPSWSALEDDVLEDEEYFRALSKHSAVKREQRIQRVAEQLRTKREKGDRYLGGSVEMKIRRIRELAKFNRKRRREKSLLDHGAVVNERIGVCVTLRNPLLSPVVVGNFSPVVSMDGKIYSANEAQINGNADGMEAQVDCPVHFFPVEQVTLAPQSSTSVVLQISIDKCGQVRFIGLTWTFTITGPESKSEVAFVPGFCVLQRRGIRLNKTRKQRASEVPLYAEDESLLVKIAPMAPKVKATLLCDGKEIKDLNMRAGEQKAAQLVIENEGQVRLDDIIIRIGTPHSMYVDTQLEEETTQDGGQAVFAIGLVEEAVKQAELVVACRLSLSLEPHETKQLCVCLRAAVHNSAFGYRSGMNGRVRRASKPTADALQVICQARLAICYGQTHTRLTRIETTMHVTPSLLVSPRFLREADRRCTPHGVLLGVEVEHAAPSDESLQFEVTDLCITSRCGWHPVVPPVPTHPLNGGKEIAPSGNVLRINETATIFVLIVRKEGEEKWNTVGGGRESTHFVVYSSFALAARKDLAYVTIRWRGGGGGGEIHIPPIDPLRWMGGEVVPVEVKKDPILVRVVHEEVIEHNFFPHTPSIAFPAVVQVMVYIKNSSNVLQDVMFVAPTGGGVSDGERGRYWGGDVSVTMRALPPGGERVLRLEAILTGGGVYNMASFTVLYQESFSNVGNRRQVAVGGSCVTVRGEGGGVALNEIPVMACFSPTREKDVFVKPDVADVVMRTVGKTGSVKTEPVKTERLKTEKMNAEMEEKRVRKVMGELKGVSLEDTRSPSPEERRLEVKKRLAPSMKDAAWNDDDTDEE